VKIPPRATLFHVKRCPKCKGRINVFSNLCHLCGSPWTPVKKRRVSEGYEPEPTTTTDLFIDRDYEDVPL